MGQSRTVTRQNQAASLSEDEAAAAIAAVLAGGFVLSAGVTPLAAVAALLRSLPGPVGASLTNAVARLVVRDRPVLGADTRALTVARFDNLLYRGHYAVAAAKRLASGSTFEQEAREFEKHHDASRQREAGARLNDAVAERFGPVLSWVHTGKAKTHRSSHVAAHGKNYDVRRPPKATEGMLPGMARHCDCVPGAPISGAETLR